MESILSASAAPYVHESAFVDAGASIGERTRIWHFCHIGSNACIGTGCTLGQNVFVAPGVRIGSNVKIQNNVSIYVGVTLEDDVFCGPSMVFTNVQTPRSGHPRNTPDDYAATLVRRGATIGANATIVCGNVVGEYAFVAAGAVVTTDVPPHTIVMGVPARPAGFACVCGARIAIDGHDGTCRECGTLYHHVDGRLARVQP